MERRVGGIQIENDNVCPEGRQHFAGEQSHAAGAAGDVDRFCRDGGHNSRLTSFEPGRNLTMSLRWPNVQDETQSDTRRPETPGKQLHLAKASGSRYFAAH